MENTISIGLICAVLGAYISYLAFQRNKTKDIKEEAKNGASINTKLDYIQKGVDDIRIDIKSQELKINGVIERLVKVEESCKSAHKRIDKIEEE